MATGYQKVIWLTNMDTHYAHYGHLRVFVVPKKKAEQRFQQYQDQNLIYNEITKLDLTKGGS